MSYKESKVGDMVTTASVVDAVRIMIDLHKDGYITDVKCRNKVFRIYIVGKEV